eukprot:symbB.v1.2.031768.t1/scaffold3724.1/size51414/2
MAWSGLGEKEKSGLTWRLGTDLNLVSHEKKLMSLADFIHKCCVVNGVASIELLDHTLIQKEYPATEGDPLKVPYRYGVSPAAHFLLDMVATTSQECFSVPASPDSTRKRKKEPAEIKPKKKEKKKKQRVPEEPEPQCPEEPEAACPEEPEEADSEAEPEVDIHKRPAANVNHKRPAAKVKAKAKTQSAKAKAKTQSAKAKAKIESAPAEGKAKAKAKAKANADEGECFECLPGDEVPDVY